MFVPTMWRCSVMCNRRDGLATGRLRSKLLGDKWVLVLAATSGAP